MYNINENVVQYSIYIYIYNSTIKVRRAALVNLPIKQEKLAIIDHMSVNIRRSPMDKYTIVP